MRIPPYHIVHRLKQYDSSLGFEWDWRFNRWWYTRDGERLFVWVHDDGVEGMEPSGCGDEIMKIIQNADSRNKSYDILKRREQGERNKEYEKIRARERKFDDCEHESMKTMDFARRGAAKPFVHVQDNPINQRKSYHG